MPTILLQGVKGKEVIITARNDWKKNYNNTQLFEQTKRLGLLWVFINALTTKYGNSQLYGHAKSNIMKSWICLAENERKKNRKLVGKWGCLFNCLFSSYFSYFSFIGAFSSFFVLIMFLESCLKFWWLDFVIMNCGITNKENNEIIADRSFGFSLKFQFFWDAKWKFWPQVLFKLNFKNCFPLY